MRARLDFRGDEVRGRIRAELIRRLRICAILVWNTWKELLNVDGTGVREPSGAKGRFLSQKAKLIYGAYPSKPGEPPHKQTGRLLASAAWEISGLVARVGSNVPYARILEFGGRFVAPRPSLRVADKLCRDRVRRILSAVMKPR